MRRSCRPAGRSAPPRTAGFTTRSKGGGGELAWSPLTTRRFALGQRRWGRRCCPLRAGRAGGGQDPPFPALYLRGELPPSGRGRWRDRSACASVSACGALLTAGSVGRAPRGAAGRRAGAGGTGGGQRHGLPRERRWSGFGRSGVREGAVTQLLRYTLWCCGSSRTYMGS